MNIGIIHPSFKVFGGAENTTMHILDALKKTEHFTTLYTVEPPVIEETQNFKVHRTNRHNFPSFWKYQRMKEIQRLFSNANQEDVLVISSGGLSLEKTTKKVILYCHSTFEADYEFLHKKFHGLKSQYYKIIQKNVKRTFEVLQSSSVKLVSNSNYTKNIINKIIQKESKVIYPPVDIKKFAKYFDNLKKNKIVTLSRFSPEKNLEFAIQVVKSSNFDYELIGNARLGSQIKLCNDLKNNIDSKNISLFYNLSNIEIENSLGSAKVYFHPSKETFGIAVVEAISAGCIPIVPNNSAFAETVPIDALRFKDKEDAVNKLKDALGGKYDHLKPMLRQYIEKFSVENFQKELLKEIESIN
ncbi:MAG: glycosyltransferase family 4 protein [Thaumarchaeota archaeon]|nr:glycosyltransferase family 4 protein [Nitrososphaerota archaeon]